MRRLIVFLTALCLGLIPDSGAQQRPEINLDEFIQKLAATQQEDANYEDLYEAVGYQQSQCR